MTDPLQLEMEAAAKYGLIPDPTMMVAADQNWFDLPRETRAVLAAGERLRALGEALDGEDARDYMKAESAREAKKPARKVR